MIDEEIVYCEGMETVAEDAARPPLRRIVTSSKRRRWRKMNSQALMSK
jgi:hypothetical protein